MKYWQVTHKRVISISIDTGDKLVHGEKRNPHERTDRSSLTKLVGSFVSSACTRAQYKSGVCSCCPDEGTLYWLESDWQISAFQGDPSHLKFIRAIVRGKHDKYEREMEKLSVWNHLPRTPGPRTRRLRSGPRAGPSGQKREEHHHHQSSSVTINHYLPSSSSILVEPLTLEICPSECLRGRRRLKERCEH